MRFLTACFLRPLSLDLSLAIRLITLMFWYCGKLNLVIFGMVPKLLWINLLLPANPNGNAKAGWSCFYLMGMRAKDQSIPVLALSAYCSFVQKIICRFAMLLPLPSTSICYEGNYTEIFVNLWL